MCVLTFVRKFSLRTYAHYGHRTSDIGQRTLDNGQRTSLKNGENENRVCPIAAIAAHWTDNKTEKFVTQQDTCSNEHEVCPMPLLVKCHPRPTLLEI